VRQKGRKEVTTLDLLKNLYWI